MNHPLICTILSFVLLAIGQISEAGPSTYEDCILESMKGVTSNRAAKAIEEACRTKFPLKRAKPTPLLKPPESYSLPLESLNNIPGTAGWSGYSLGTKPFRLQHVMESKRTQGKMWNQPWNLQRLAEAYAHVGRIGFCRKYWRIADSG